MKRVVGIDASLTGTAVVVIDHDEEAGTYAIVFSELIQTKGKKGDTLEQRWKRLTDIANRVCELAFDRDLAPDLVVIEAPSYGSTHGHAHDRSGLWWLIVDMMMDYCVPVASVAPQGRAKYATGKGNAAKDAVLSAVVKRYDEFDVDNNNVADGIVLAAMGSRYLDLPIEENDPPQLNLDAMSGAAWPS